MSEKISNNIDNINEKLLRPYDPKETESRIYKLWEESGYFNPDNLPERHKEPFCVIMPPPNANGSLHAGHAVFVTLEDLIIRYKRMLGFKTLWLPGADHAGFETQVVYEKKLEKEGRSRFQMKREELYKEIFDFTMQNKSFMENQLRELGASCDWSREKFTLEKDIIKTVYETFKKLADDGLLYRGKRVINWCVKHQTSLSELETISEEQTDQLYYIKYGPFVIATVRPETIFGDVAVAVNPNDPRHKDLIGQEIEVDLLTEKRKMKVIADDYVDMEFGTGALKVTPAHDPNDFEIAKRHDLPSIEVIDQFGKLNEKTGKYAGLKAEEARKVVVQDLEKAGLLLKREDYKHAVKKCYKCERIIEPRILPQWFIKIKPLAEEAAKAVKNGEVKFVTEKFEKIFFHWIENIQDWNISRQIVWGIRIPAKICDNCDEGYADIKDEITKCPKCAGGVHQDNDTFDTWFSSGQWPFAALGYPDNRDFKTFYPTAVMETGFDIIFFWVARMIMLGIYRTGKAPFKTIYLHGLIRDVQKQKMSKSKGNVISPTEMTEKYGTDAFRMALIVGNTPGSDMALSEDKIRGYKHFSNKIWNIARFVVSGAPDTEGTLKEPPKLTEKDSRLLKELGEKIKEVTDDIENYRFYLAGEKLYHYVWHTFADVIIEEAKPRLKPENPNTADRLSCQYTLRKILETSIKALHPFMPFITEEIWSIITDKKELLMIEEWPKD
ncbi:valine--tRNA ligase [Candidatus Parcubacteria bacterium]|nr:MAG: valine--tRNA ligase [Candidatus Parcubacteria bacterium]